MFRWCFAASYIRASCWRGKLFFPHQADGSLVERDGKIVGSQLIAQPFSDDKYFQPRPSAASYNGAASGASNWSGSNYALRDRVAQQLGPIVKYAGGIKKGKLVGPDIEAWFQKDKLAGQKGIVAQWANLHNGSAQNWVKNDMSNGKYGLCGQYIQEWQKTHKAEVDAEVARIDAAKKANPDKPAPSRRTIGLRLGSRLSPIRPLIPSQRTWLCPSLFGFPASTPACSPAQLSIRSPTAPRKR